MNRKKKLLSNMGVLAFGTFGSKIVVFLLMPFYTAWLSTEQYGAAELISSTANLLIPLACVGIANGIFRFAAERESDKRAVFSTSLALLGIGSLVFLALSPLLCLIGPIKGSVWLVIAYVLSANLQSVCAQYVRAVDRTTLFSVQGILNTLLTVLFNVLFLAVWDMGVLGYVLSVIVGNLLTALFLAIAARLWLVFSVRAISRRMMRELLVFSLPMIPTTVCWLITDLSDRYMVNYFCGGAVNGIYSAAYKLPTVVTLVSGIFMQAWQLSAVAESSDEEGCRSFYSEVFRGFLSVTAIGGVWLVLLVKPLSEILLNRAYFDAWRYMPTLLCAAVIEAIVAFLATVYMVKKKSMHSFLTAMIGACLNLLLNLCLIPEWGALGAAVATLTAYVAVWITRMIDAPRMIGFSLCLPRQLTSLVLLFGAAALMTLEVYGAFWWTLAIAVAVTVINAPALVRGVRGVIGARIRR